MCCKALLEDWLSSDRGVKPKTWKNLLKAIGEVEELQPLLDEIKQGLQSEGDTFESVCLCMCVCVCICMCMRMCVCMCLCVCDCAYVGVCMRVSTLCVCACAQVCVGMYI